MNTTTDRTVSLEELGRTHLHGTATESVLTPEHAEALLKLLYGNGTTEPTVASSQGALSDACASEDRGWRCEEVAGHTGEHTHWVEGFGTVSWPNATALDEQEG